MLSQFWEASPITIFEQAKKPTIKSHCVETLGITLSKYSNLNFHLSRMAFANTLVTEAIPTMEITIIHTDNEPSIHVEHFFDI